jgi:two-component system NtrC family response regulator
VINLPALRERENDIRLLAQEFLRRFGAETRKEGLIFEQDAIKALARHSWPGNVRELENRVKRAVIMAESTRLSADDLELNGALSPGTGTTLKEARESVERELINQALRRHSGKIAPAAADLGVSRPTLYELMEKLGIARREREGKNSEAA